MAKNNTIELVRGFTAKKDSYFEEYAFFEKTAFVDGGASTSLYARGFGGYGLSISKNSEGK